MEGVDVSFQVVEGGGTATLSRVPTDVLGRARGLWILGPTPSPQRLRATVAGLTVEFQATVIEAIPGQSYFGRSHYIEYLPGDIPLIVSAPHGGDLTPAEIPDRTYGTMGADRNTVDLALRIREAIKSQTGGYPYVILSHLYRNKLDPNREIVEAAQGDPEAERAWWEFQTFIDAAAKSVEDGFGEGFYIDLHGHGHEILRLELGYLLTATDLGNTNEVLSGGSFANKSSLRALAQSAGVAFADLLRGPTSLGALMEAEAFPAVPSLSQPSPGGDPYFSAGYNTARHGSRDGGTVSGVQIECNFTGVRDTEANRQAFAEALGRALATYFSTHFEMELAPLPSPAGG